jgi:hypothetical protein
MERLSRHRSPQLRRHLEQSFVFGDGEAVGHAGDEVGDHGGAGDGSATDAAARRDSGKSFGSVM